MPKQPEVILLSVALSIQAVASAAGKQTVRGLKATKHRSTGMNATFDHFTDLWPADFRVKLYSAEPSESITQLSTAFSDHGSLPQKSSFRV